MSTNTRRRGARDDASDKVLARRALARISTIAFLVAAGAIHTAQIGVHLDEWSLGGLFFIASAIAQVGLGVALTRGMDWRAREVRGLVRSFSAPPSRKLIIGVIVTSLSLVAVWAISRTAGIPFGPSAGIAEPVNRPDSLATTFELLTLAAIAPLLSRRSTRRTSWVPRRAHTVIVGVLLLSTLGTTALALQPVNCDAAPHAEELTKKEKANQALIDAFVYHGKGDAHSLDRLEHDEQGHVEQLRDEQDQAVHAATEPGSEHCH